MILLCTGTNIGNVLALSLSGVMCTSGVDGGWPLIFYVFGEYQYSVQGLIVCTLKMVYMLASRFQTHALGVVAEWSKVLSAVPWPLMV